MKKHIVWSNYDLGSLEDWQDFLEENGYTDLPEDEQWEHVADLNSLYLDDERCNFHWEEKHVPLKRAYNGYNDEGYTILAIANLGLWNGRHVGIKFINSLEDILESDCEYAEWYCDRYHLRGKMSHHDGTNYVQYVLFTGCSSDYYNTDGENKFLEDLVYGNPISKSRWHRYTKSLRPYIAEIYGW